MNAPLTTRAGEGYDRKAWTVTELRVLTDAGLFDEADPFELIGGELLAVSPRYNGHEIWKTNLANLLPRLLPHDIVVAVESTLFLSERSAPEPDLFIRRRGVAPEDVRPSEVLLLIEVSDSSGRRDLVTKAQLYAEHGVPHYWVLDAERRRAVVHCRPGLEGYGLIETFGMDAVLALPFLPSLSLRLADLDEL